MRHCWLCIIYNHSLLESNEKSVALAQLLLLGHKQALYHRTAGRALEGTAFDVDSARLSKRLILPDGVDVDSIDPNRGRPDESIPSRILIIFDFDPFNRCINSARLQDRLEQFIGLFVVRAAVKIEKFDSDWFVQSASGLNIVEEDVIFEWQKKNLFLI